VWALTMPACSAVSGAGTGNELPLPIRQLRGKAATTDVAETDYVGPARSSSRRSRTRATQISGSLFMLTMMEKQIRGSLYGSSNAQHDIPRMLELYNNGQLKLDELQQAREAAGGARWTQRSPTDGGPHDQPRS
jgi:hypothetical protein